MFPNPTYEKLDRVLANVEWEQKFPLVTVLALSRAISYHTPLLVDSGEATHVGNKNTFSFELAWFEREEFLDLITRELAKDPGTTRKRPTNGALVLPTNGALPVRH